MSEIHGTTTVSPAGQSALSELEWRVVEMGRIDGPRSLNPDGFWPSLMRKLFKISVPNRLANDALEMLRRFSVRAWHWNQLRTKDVLALIDAGYTRADALLILEHVATQRGCMPSVQDDLFMINSRPEGSLAPHHRLSDPVHAPPAPRGPSLAPRCGRSDQHQGRLASLCG